MGKKDFAAIYRRAKTKMQKKGLDLTCKLSSFCDSFDPKKNYAGVIVYCVDGKTSWKIDGSKAEARNQNGRTFYVIIKTTEGIKPKAGKSLVHHHPVGKVLGRDITDGSVLCGGFTYHERLLKYNSVSLNLANNQKGKYSKSDGSKRLSAGEIRLVDYCFEKYKENKGGHLVFSIPSDVERAILSPPKNTDVKKPATPKETPVETSSSDETDDDEPVNSKSSCCKCKCSK